MDDLESFFCLLFFLPMKFGTSCGEWICMGPVFSLYPQQEMGHTVINLTRNQFTTNVMNTLISDKWNMGVFFGQLMWIQCV